MAFVSLFLIALPHQFGKTPWLDNIPIDKWPTYVSVSEIGNYNLVSDIILNSQWNLSILETLFPPLIIARVRSIHILLNSNEDTWIWSLTPSGKTMVSSSYRHYEKSSLEYTLGRLEYHLAYECSSKNQDFYLETMLEQTPNL